MKYNGFYDLEHARMYLKGSIIRLGTEPIYVLDVIEVKNHIGKKIQRIKYLLLSSQGKQQNINIKSKKLNLAPVPLGFMNYCHNGTYKCVYLSRIPARMWKIGLHPQNLSILPCAGNRNTDMNTSNVILSSGFRDTVMGKFPTYKQAIKTVDKGNIYSTVAFNRNFAIQKRMSTVSLIYYKYEAAIGECSLSGPKLRKSFSFLQEHLDEAM